MSKIRLCKFCGKDITADWPRLKKVCDAKECQDKQYREHVLYMRERDRKRRLKKRLENPRYCIVCGGQLPPELHALKKTCANCEAKYKKELKRKERERKKEWEKKNQKWEIPAHDKEPKSEFYLRRPGDFSQAEYEKQQAELNKFNGRKCIICGKNLRGLQWLWCEKCRNAVNRKADVVRCDAGFQYDQAGGQRYNWSLLGE